jgi:hypothetical protein
VVVGTEATTSVVAVSTKDNWDATETVVTAVVTLLLSTVTVEAFAKTLVGPDGKTTDRVLEEATEVTALVELSPVVVVAGGEEAVTTLVELSPVTVVVTGAELAIVVVELPSVVVITVAVELSPVFVVVTEVSVTVVPLDEVVVVGELESLVGREIGMEMLKDGVAELDKAVVELPESVEVGKDVSVMDATIEDMGFVADVSVAELLDDESVGVEVAVMSVDEAVEETLVESVDVGRMDGIDNEIDTIFVVDVSVAELLDDESVGVEVAVTSVVETALVESIVMLAVDEVAAVSAVDETAEVVENSGSEMEMMGVIDVEVLDDESEEIAVALAVDETVDEVVENSGSEMEMMGATDVEVLDDESDEIAVALAVVDVGDKTVVLSLAVIDVAPKTVVVAVLLDEGVSVKPVLDGVPVDETAVTEIPVVWEALCKVSV